MMLNLEKLGPTNRTNAASFCSLAFIINVTSFYSKSILVFERKLDIVKEEIQFKIGQKNPKA